jgi:23S rRNA (cytosine1962-C5)-methyltransferase
MAEQHLTTKGFEGYELIDSGEHEKLERFGDVVLRRPDTQAIWKKQKPELWDAAHARFAFLGGKGGWNVTTPVPETWSVPFKGATFLAKLSNFKHVGLFPEQEQNWAWSEKMIGALSSPDVLNLFGYTGAASIVAARAGAQVTHVDSSKASIGWAKENAVRSGIKEESIRYILEDARGFAKREARRGAKYDGIILDPPAFGRGAKDEVWKIEEDLLPLMETLKELLKDAPGSFFLLNGYAAGYAPLAFMQLVESVFPGEQAEFGELRIGEKESTRAISAGMYVRFARSRAITNA